MASAPRRGRSVGARLIIVGLGNPGAEHEGTRHNIGFLVVDAARRRWRGSRWASARDHRWSEIRLAGRSHRLIQPTTYMNASGDAVATLLREGVAADELIIVLDDIDLPFGHLRIRPGGGSGGHRGLGSILDELAPATVARMRVGIGRPEPSDEAADYVLDRFSDEEEARLEPLLARVLDALQTILRAGVVAAMNRFNGLPAPWADPAEGRTAAGPGVANSEEQREE